MTQRQQLDSNVTKPLLQYGWQLIRPVSLQFSLCMTCKILIWPVPHPQKLIFYSFEWVAYTSSKFPGFPRTCQFSFLPEPSTFHFIFDSWCLLFKTECHNSEEPSVDQQYFLFTISSMHRILVTWPFQTSNNNIPHSLHHSSWGFGNGTVLKS